MTLATAPSVARSSLTMFGGSVASRVLGVVRNGLITAIIGASFAGDAFSLANTLPNVLYVLAAGGILNAVLIPSLARAMKLEDGGQEFTDRVITVALTGMAVITVAVMAGASGFVWLLARNSSPEFKDLALAFSLICLPQIFFYGLFALLGQILNARGRFGAFAWAPFLANVVAVAGLLLFIVLFPNHARGEAVPEPRTPQEWTGPMIWLFAGSATLSVIVQALSLVPALRRTGFHYRPRWGIRGVGLGGVSRLAMWAFYGLAISQLGFFISQGALNNATASGEKLGLDDIVRGPAAYAVAFTLFMLPHAFVTVSIITALFPRFSAAAASGDDDSLKRDFRTGLTMPLVANVPIMAFVMVLAGPIVALLNPGLDPRSVQVSASVLVIMILGLVPFGIDLLCYRMFFALEDGRPTVTMQVLLTGISLLAGLFTLFVNPVWAIGVMAFGQTIGNIVSSGAGLMLLRRRIGALGLSSVLVTASRIGLAAAVAGLVAWGATTVLEPILGGTIEGSSTILKRMFAASFEIGLVGLVFVSIYLGLAHALHVREIRDLSTMVRQRLVR
ncbi:putative peptidoglycan lipid II flippase [Humibacillus xanthopallidus]|uniref:Putative peptidoglycan lipid II flippase n=1 Tax=Humibacillus xanthopallidus TaxID=412689 RepID=A0A543PUA3_9MICO|nr:murein biosynthesis integral membrane protein MurJ [Humibacillus xanthopallidus]TQN47651.1 putative peptidoglycan lipid II flippase [Humibacillus xanthopallidus]